MPSLEESAVQCAIMEAISAAARQNADVLQTLKLHIGMGLRSCLDKVYVALDALQNHPLAYDDSLVRQTFSRVIAVSKHLIRVVFPGGLEVEQEVESVR